MSRRLARSDQATSAVVGTIVLLAITAALALIVLLLSPWGADKVQPAPRVGFAPDSGTDTVRVVTAPELDWGQIRAAVTCSEGTPTLTRNGVPVPLTGHVADPVDPSPTPAKLRGGFDALHVSCSVPGATATLALVHKPTGQIMASPWTFKV